MKFDSHEIYFISEKQISYLRKRIWFLARNFIKFSRQPIQYNLKLKANGSF